MAQFYAEIQGNRGSASRMGSKHSGLQGHLRGWHVGVRVNLSNIDGVDVIDVYRTGGSNDHSATKHIITLREDDDGNS